MQVTISTPGETQPMEINASIFGFGQDASGGPQMIPADQYNSSISAINIIKVIPSSFRLEPNQSQVVTVEANMPANARAGTKYALVNIRGLPREVNRTVNIALGVNERVELTVAGSKLIRTGNITSMDLKPDGNATLILKNTGNTDFGALAEAELLDDQGKVFAHATPSNVWPFGIFPTYSCKFILPFNHGNKLTPGKYTINATVKLDDGTEIANKKESFDIK